MSIEELERQVESSRNADECCARYSNLVEALKEENELLRNALEAAKQVGMRACARGTETAMKGMHVAAQLMEVSAENERLTKALSELSNKINLWADDEKSATEGKYGPSPKGEPIDYWRGRVAVLFELKAFLPTLGEHYIHVAELSDVKAENERLKGELKECVDALKTALRQWEHYSDELRPDDDLKYASDLEGESFRNCQIALKSAEKELEAKEVLK